MRNRNLSIYFIAVFFVLAALANPIFAGDNLDNNNASTILSEETKHMSINVLGKVLSDRESVYFYNAFGTVSNTIKMSAELFTSLMNNSEENILLKVKDGDIQILDDYRTELYPSNNVIDPEEVFFVFSKDKLMELLTLGNSNEISFEILKGSKNISIRSGEFLLCEAVLCPPFCSGGGF